MTSISVEEGFGPSLRAWRQFRRLSQLELSLTAEISQRHLSWLETGRSRPSRDMVVQLAEALHVPLRERNRMLNAAGFAAIYQERGLDEEQMRAVRSALRKMLDQQMPYPSLVVDREWNVLMTNDCAEALLAGAVGDGFWREVGTGAQRNIALLTLHPRGLRPLIANWDEAAYAFIQRLRGDLERSADPELRERIESLIALAGGPISGPQVPSRPLLPMLTLDLRFGEQLLRLFSVISTFGTAQDVTAEELRIESFFPLDAEGDAILRRLAGV